MTPELARFLEVFPAPSGDIVLAALDDEAAGRFDTPGVAPLRGLLLPWGLVAWLRPAALLSLLSPEQAAGVAQRGPGLWLLTMTQGRFDLEQIGDNTG